MVKDEEDCYEFEVRGNVCNIKINNTNISTRDPIEMRSLDNNFKQHNIWKWCCKVGFFPMNRNISYFDKVCQKLSSSQAPIGDQWLQIEMLVSDYDKNEKRPQR